MQPARSTPLGPPPVRVLHELRRGTYEYVVAPN